MISVITLRNKCINFKLQETDVELYGYSKTINVFYLGLEILAESPAGANRVMAQSVSAVLVCTSGESYARHAKGMYGQ